MRNPKSKKPSTLKVEKLTSSELYIAKFTVGEPVYRTMFINPNYGSPTEQQRTIGIRAGLYDWFVDGDISKEEYEDLVKRLNLFVLTRNPYHLFTKSTE